MEDFSIEVQKRPALGSASNRRIRREGLLPCVVYHRHEESIPGIVSYKDFVRVAQKAKSTQVFKLKSTDDILNGRSVLVRDIQRNYVKGNVLHVDFQALKEDEEITVRVPLEVRGEAPGVKTDGGILSLVTHELGVACLPAKIPSIITIDISSLHLGQSIHAQDIPLPEGVRLIDDPEETVVTVVAVRATVEAGAEAGAAGGEAAATATPTKE